MLQRTLLTFLLVAMCPLQSLAQPYDSSEIYDDSELYENSEIIDMMSDNEVSDALEEDGNATASEFSLVADSIFPELAAKQEGAGSAFAAPLEIDEIAVENERPWRIHFSGEVVAKQGYEDISIADLETSGTRYLNGTEEDANKLCQDILTNLKQQLPPLKTRYFDNFRVSLSIAAQCINHTPACISPYENMFEIKYTCDVEADD